MLSFQLPLLEQSLEQIRPRQDEFATQFYATLFVKYPDLKPYFAHVDMVKQQQMLISALILIVKSLEKPKLLAVTIKSLAERHRRYGAMTEQFPYLGEALFATFAAFLGEGWTTEMEQSWRNAYALISQQMIEGLQKTVA